MYSIRSFTLNTSPPFGMIAITRIESYYLPKIGSQLRRVLDAGCGNGISVDLLVEAVRSQHASGV